MTAKTYAEKKADKRRRRPIYVTCMRLVDPVTGEEFGAFVPTHPIDRRLAKERGFRVGHEYRSEIKQARISWQHRLVHKIGQLMIDNVEGWEQLRSHDAVKRLQLESGVCCEVDEIDARPVIRAVLALVQILVGKRTYAKLASNLPLIATVPVKRAESLAYDEMEQDRFEQLFDGITEYIGANYAHVMLDEVRAEFWDMAGLNRGANLPERST